MSDIMYARFQGTRLKVTLRLSSEADLNGLLGALGKTSSRGVVFPAIGDIGEAIPKSSVRRPEESQQGEAEAPYERDPKVKRPSHGSVVYRRDAA